MTGQSSPGGSTHNGGESGETQDPEDGGPASDVAAPGQQRPRGGFVIALLLAFVATGFFALSSYLWVDWGSSGERAIYSTISLTFAAALLALLVQAATSLDSRVIVGLVIGFAAILLIGCFGLAYWKNRQPTDITGAVFLNGKSEVTVTDGGTFAISAKLPESGKKMKLGFTGEDQDPGTGADCAPQSRLTITGSKLQGKQVLEFGKTVSLPIDSDNLMVQFKAELDTGEEPDCRIKVTPDRVTIYS